MSRLLALLLLLGISSIGQAQVRVIFDTDMDTDCDDAGALAILHTLADRGETQILATVVSSHYAWSAPCTQAINVYRGRPDLPIGVPKGPGADTKRGSRYARQIAGQFPTPLKTNEQAPDAVEVYRRVLAGEKDGSVVIVTVGYLTNLAALLDSKADKHSALSGPELIKRKVKLWVCMGGRYPKHLDPGVYGNFKPDPKAAVRAAQEWPGPVVFTGLGNDIETGASLSETPADNPVRRVYELYLGKKKTRPSWDPIAVLYAVQPEADFWKVHVGGRCHIFPNGTNEWREGAETNHRLLELTPGQKEKLRKALDALMSAPRKEPRK